MIALLTLLNGKMDLINSIDWLQGSIFVIITFLLNFTYNHFFKSRFEDWRAKRSLKVKKRRREELEDELAYITELKESPHMLVSVYHRHLSGLVVTIGAVSSFFILALISLFDADLTPLSSAAFDEIYQLSSVVCLLIFLAVFRYRSIIRGRSSKMLQFDKYVAEIKEKIARFGDH